MGGRVAAVVCHEEEAVVVAVRTPPRSCIVQTWTLGARGGCLEVGEGGCHEEEATANGRVPP
jgi:hypothetical protein